MAAIQVMGRILGAADGGGGERLAIMADDDGPSQRLPNAAMAGPGHYAPKGYMKKITVRAIALSAALSLCIPVPAVAQGRDFYVMQFNSTVRDFNKVVDEINSLKTGIKTEKDFTRGCSMLGSLVYNLDRAKALAGQLAEYAYRIDDMDAHRQALEQNSAYAEESAFWAGERSRICG